MSIDSTVLDLLIVLTKMSHKFVSLECAIISKIVSNDDSISEGKLLVILLGTNCLSSREAKLMFDVEIPAGMVDENASSNILF